MKSREHRQTIRVSARMKVGSTWQDVAINNASAHGLGISVAIPPRPGTYIEIRRASQVIVARAVWSAGTECGLRTQDVVDIPALVNTRATQAEAMLGQARAERRRTPRVDDSAARSRRFAAAFQFAVMALALAGAAGSAAWIVSDAIRRPFSDIRMAMGGDRPAAAGSAEDR